MRAGQRLAEAAPGEDHPGAPLLDAAAVAIGRRALAVVRPIVPVAVERLTFDDSEPVDGARAGRGLKTAVEGDNVGGGVPIWS